MVASFSFLIEHPWDTTIFYNRLIVVFGVGDPDDLHFALICSQSQVYLLMPWVQSDFYLGNSDELLKCDLLILI
jgi:hypothetical protein